MSGPPGRLLGTPGAQAPSAAGYRSRRLSESSRLPSGCGFMRSCSLRSGSRLPDTSAIRRIDAASASPCAASDQPAGQHARYGNGGTPTATPAAPQPSSRECDKRTAAPASHRDAGAVRTSWCAVRDPLRDAGFSKYGVAGSSTSQARVLPIARARANHAAPGFCLCRGSLRLGRPPGRGANGGHALPGGLGGHGHITALVVRVPSGLDRHSRSVGSVWDHRVGVALTGADAEVRATSSPSPPMVAR